MYALKLICVLLVYGALINWINYLVRWTSQKSILGMPEYSQVSTAQYLVSNWLLEESGLTPSSYFDSKLFQVALAYPHISDFTVCSLKNGLQYSKKCHECSFIFFLQTETHLDLKKCTKLIAVPSDKFSTFLVVSKTNIITYR